VEEWRSEGWKSGEVEEWRVGRAERWKNGRVEGRRVMGWNLEGRDGKGGGGLGKRQ
jgi:hypothetical protein